jgi:hypothetical protein
LLDYTLCKQIIHNDSRKMNRLLVTQLNEYNSFPIKVENEYKRKQVVYIFKFLWSFWILAVNIKICVRQSIPNKKKVSKSYLNLVDFISKSLNAIQTWSIQMHHKLDFVLTTDIWNGAHDGCDPSAEDAYFSEAPDPTFTFVGGPCCPTLDFVIAFWFTIAFYTLLTSLFCTPIIEDR